jgi:hypothetical protein
MSLGTMGRSVLFAVCAAVLLGALVGSAWAVAHVLVLVTQSIADGANGT